MCKSLPKEVKLHEENKRKHIGECKIEFHITLIFTPIFNYLQFTFCHFHLVNLTRNTTKCSL